MQLGGENTPKYIVLMKGTQKGVANPEELPRDVQAAREALGKFGGRLLDWNLTMGPYDAVATVDFPDDQAAVAFTLSIGKTGNQMTTTMRAFGEAELKQIVERIP